MNFWPPFLCKINTFCNYYTRRGWWLKLCKTEIKHGMQSLQQRRSSSKFWNRVSLHLVAVFFFLCLFIAWLRPIIVLAMTSFETSVLSRIHLGPSLVVSKALHCCYTNKAKPYYSWSNWESACRIYEMKEKTTSSNPLANKEPLTSRYYNCQTALESYFQDTYCWDALSKASLASHCWYTFPLHAWPASKWQRRLRVICRE